MRNQDDVLRVQGGHKVSPVCDDLGVLVVRRLRFLVQIGLDGVQKCFQARGQALERDRRLHTRVAADTQHLLLLDVFRSVLDAHGYALQLPVVEFVSRAVGFTGIRLDTDSGFLEGIGDLLDACQEGLSFLLGGARGEAAGDDDDLVGRDTGREDQPLVVAVNHNHDSNDAGRQTPRVLPDKKFLIVFRVAVFPVGILDDDVEHLAKVLAETVGCGTLDSAASGRDIALAGSCEKAASEFLFFGLASLNCWNGEELGVHACVPVKDCQDLGLSSCLSLVRGVAFLPEELAGAEEGLWVLEFPADNRVPLVELKGKIAVGADPFSVIGVHDGFGGGPDRNVFLKLSIATADFVN